MRIFPILLLVTAATAAQVPHHAPNHHSRLRHHPVVVRDVAIEVKLDGPTTRVHQELTLSNSSSRPQEFDLVFPLGTGSVISGLELKVGQQVLEGRIFGAEEARQIYRAIVQKTRDPALLEHYGEGMFRARVFPVPARSTQTVTLSYNQIVKPEGDLLRLHLPLTAFRRVAGPLNLTIKGEVRSLHPVTTFYSPTHEVAASKVFEIEGSPKKYGMNFEIKARQVRPESDFVAFLKARPGNSLLDVTVLSACPDPNAHGYFLAVINGIPTKDTDPEPKDVVFVLDRSGSMQGKKLEQAKGALKFLVERLRPVDRFNLVTYSATVDLYAKELQASSPENLLEAARYIDGLEANGGTNIGDALARALDQFSGKERLHQVVFLTDGLPTVGERNPRTLAAAVKKANALRVRIVAFGLGFDVNSALLDRLAVENHGLSEYVLPNENIEEKVPGFYGRMLHPLVRDASFELAGTKVLDVFPQSAGDLYGGHQLVFTGRYTKGGKARLVLRGVRKNAPVEFVYEVDLAEDGKSGSGGQVPRIWAAKKIGYLVDEIRLNGTNKELVDEIVRLGTRFGILTEYTSFLAAPDTDLGALTHLQSRAFREFEGRGQIITGGAGVAQAANSKSLQRGAQVRDTNKWLDDQGLEQTIETVQTVKGHTLFARGGVWQTADVKEAEKARAEIVSITSDAYFTYIQEFPWLAACVARTQGNLMIPLKGRLVNFRAD